MIFAPIDLRSCDRSKNHVEGITPATKIVGRIDNRSGRDGLTIRPDQGRIENPSYVRKPCRSTRAWTSFASMAQRDGDGWPAAGLLLSRAVPGGPLQLRSFWAWLLGQPALDGDLHGIFHRIFEGHLDSEQAVVVGRFGLVGFHGPTQGQCCHILDVPRRQVRWMLSARIFTSMVSVGTPGWRIPLPACASRRQRTRGVRGETSFDFPAFWHLPFG